MGIDGLYKFINKNIPDVYDNIGIYDIKGQSCIIDGMQHIYSQLIYMRSREKEIINKSGGNISHIHGLINSLTYYFKNGVVPIFIFDGKAPDIKRKKIEERRTILKDNLKKLKELDKKKKEIDEIINKLSSIEKTEDIENLEDIEDNKYNENNQDNDENLLEDNKDELIFGTPPDNLCLEEEMQKMNNIQEEYKKIYKKSIVLKDYYIGDWIMILELLGLPVIKAKGEADPLCAYLLKNNRDIYGIISDDSDMLIFGAPVLMRKSINQQFTIIRGDCLLKKIIKLLKKEISEDITFTFDNLVDFAILLGTDYGNFTLNKKMNDSLEILKYYVNSDKDISKIISYEQIEYFNIIKKYYTEFEPDEDLFNKINDMEWNKPKLLELKLKLLEYEVDEDYIDKNNEIINLYYKKIMKAKQKKKYNYYGFDNKKRVFSFDSSHKNILIDNDIQSKNNKIQKFAEEIHKFRNKNLCQKTNNNYYEKNIFKKDNKEDNTNYSVSDSTSKSSSSDNPDNPDNPDNTKEFFKMDD